MGEREVFTKCQHKKRKIEKCVNTLKMQEIL